MIIGATDATALTGFAWVPSLVRETLLLVAAAGVLLLQYRRRSTSVARVLSVAVLFAAQCAPLLPWRTAWRLEQMLTPGSRPSVSTTARAIAVAFAPGAGRFQPAPGQAIDDVLEKPGFGPVDVAEENQRRRAEGARTVFLPVRLSGLLPNSRLLADRTEIRLIGRDGHTVYQGTGNDLELRPMSTDTTVHQGIRVPSAVFSRRKRDP
ncbi:MAG: hypothetical protein LAN59_11175, partial [Acidobacteriia bacterium]|nr:hypothetical protein [Terriglobia bacterium]